MLNNLIDLGVFSKMNSIRAEKDPGLKNISIRDVNGNYQDKKNKYDPDYQLPELKTVFPSNCNSLSESPKMKTWVKWAFEYSQMSPGAFKKIEETSRFIDYFYSFCLDQERYENLVKICLIDFVFDDQIESRFNHFDMQGEYKTALITATQFGLIADKLDDFESTSIINWKPYTKARYALSDTVHKKLNSVQENRFSELTRYVSQGLIDEVQFVFNHKRFNSLAEYTQMRHKTIGFPLYFHLIEYADQLFVPDQEWKDIRFQKLLELAATHVIFVNDFFSFEKEIREQKNKHGKVFNAVSLIIQLEGLSIGKAFESLAKIIGDLEEEILIVENEIIRDEFFSKDTRTFIEKMNYLMGGHFKVYFNVYNRYYQAK